MLYVRSYSSISRDEVEIYSSRKRMVGKWLLLLVRLLHHIIPYKVKQTTNFYRWILRNPLGKRRWMKDNNCKNGAGVI